MLFDINPQFPPGFIYHEKFITHAEEIFLHDEIARLNLHPLIFQGFEAKRKVQSFGYDYNFSSRQIRKGLPIPPPFNFLLQKIADLTGISVSQFAEVLVTEYPEGSVINWHRDAPPFDIIIGISLLADCIFKLRPYGKSLKSRKAVISFPVKRRSLYIMQGEVRSHWEHSIAPVKSQRYSITVRTLKAAANSQQTR